MPWWTCDRQLGAVSGPALDQTVVNGRRLAANDLAAFKGALARLAAFLVHLSEHFVLRETGRSRDTALAINQTMSPLCILLMRRECQITAQPGTIECDRNLTELRK
jgi:hypothetical protein